MKIELNNISHSFVKGKKALNDISLELNTGVTGLLGANGAGKSTLINTIATIFKPQAGQYFIDEIDAFLNPNEVRNVLGFLPQNFGFIPEFTPLEFLNYIGVLKGGHQKVLKDNILDLLTYLNLTQVKNTPMKNLSGGMKQRVGIAQALINKPKLLILDEPMVGLDPNERNAFTQLLTRLAHDTLIIISSHIIDDIENLCSNIVLLENGVTKFTGNITNLLAQTNGAVYEVILTKQELAELQINQHYQIVRTKLDGERIKVRYVSTNGQFGNSLAVVPQLEDAFILATKN